MEYSSLLDATKKVARKEGVAAFWKGFWPLFLRNGPHMVITFAVLEQMQRLASKARTAEANRKSVAAVDALARAVGFGAVLIRLSLLLPPRPSFLTAVFHSLDADGNGVVDFSEFVSVFAHIGSLRPEGSGASEEALRAEAAALFREVDADGSGAIDVQGELRRGAEFLSFFFLRAHHCALHRVCCRGQEDAANHSPAGAPRRV
jgi:Ca2+-binding EF-hand superfamily protein